jgi:hypothetical protein
MQAARRGRTDVHAGPLPYRFESLEDLDIPGVVLLRHEAGVRAKKRAEETAKRLSLQPEKTKRA